MFRKSDRAEKSEVFEFIKRKGGDKAVVYYSGGNDEGGVDRIVILKGDKMVCRLQESCFENPSSEDRFLNRLTAPVYDRYDDFAGEFYVDGEVVWDINSKTCKNEANERAMEEYDMDEEYDL